VVASGLQTACGLGANRLGADARSPLHFFAPHLETPSVYIAAIAIVATVNRAGLRRPPALICDRRARRAARGRPPGFVPAALFATLIGAALFSRISTAT
jgi:hypothetical protein